MEIPIPSINDNTSKVTGRHYHGYFIRDVTSKTGMSFQKIPESVEESLAVDDAPDSSCCTPQLVCTAEGTNFNPISEEKEISFVGALERIINCASLENESDTPDWILAQYLRDCMKAFNKASNSRRNWYGHPENPDADKR